MFGGVASVENGGIEAVERALRRARELVESDLTCGHRFAPSELRLARYVEADHVGDLSVLAFCLLNTRTR
jgi:hypothetical protein